MDIVILGAGESGTGAALLAKRQGLNVFVSDSGNIAYPYKNLLQLHQIPFEEGNHTIENIQIAKEVIKSPGISNEASIITFLLQKNIPIIGEIEFAARYTKATIIAITGSNGKTTTAHLTYHLLKKNGYNVGLAGNVGHSFAKSLTESMYDYYVLELSSFQIEQIEKFKPHIVGLLNITPDHLDRYRYCLESYAKAKLKLLKNMIVSDHFIYNKDDPTLTSYLARQKPTPQCYPITLLPHNDSSSIRIKNGKFRFNLKHKKFSISSNLLSLPGPHNQFNAMVAITAASLVGVSPSTITASLPLFYGLPHRLEWCGAPKGVDCYNDSKATNIESAAVALGSFNRPIIWIVGGKDKGNDYTILLPLIEKKVKAIICLGKNNQPIVQAFSSLGIPLEETKNMQSALYAAFSFALPNDVLLLSPACASFDLFKNFEDRGNQFKKIVQQLLQTN